MSVLLTGNFCESGHAQTILVTILPVSLDQLITALIFVLYLF